MKPCSCKQYFRRYGGKSICDKKLPLSYQDIQHSIVKLAELVNEQEKGQAMLRKMDARRNALKEKIQTTRKSSDKIVVELTYNGTYGMRQDIFGVLCELSMCKMVCR